MSGTPTPAELARALTTIADKWLSIPELAVSNMVLRQCAAALSRLSQVEQGPAEPEQVINELELMDQAERAWMKATGKTERPQLGILLQWLLSRHAFDALLDVIETTDAAYFAAVKRAEKAEQERDASDAVVFGMSDAPDSTGYWDGDDETAACERHRSRQKAERT